MGGGGVCRVYVGCMWGVWRVYVGYVRGARPVPGDLSTNISKGVRAGTIPAKWAVKIRERTLLINRHSLALLLSLRLVDLPKFPHVQLSACEQAVKNNPKTTLTEKKSHNVNYSNKYNDSVLFYVLLLQIGACRLSPRQSKES